MTVNPYEAPNAPLERPDSSRPLQVKIAVILLWTALLGSMFWTQYLAVSAAIGLNKDLYTIGMILTVLSGPLVICGLLVFVWFRFNWARWVWLIFAALSFAFGAPRQLRSIGPLYEAAKLHAYVYYALLLIGTILLFFGPGARWFRRANSK